MIENFDKNIVEEKINKENLINKLKEDSKNAETIHKGLSAIIPTYELFREMFFESNPDCTEEDFNFVIRKKKGVYYIDFKKIDLYQYNMPHGECKGFTLLEKRKFTIGKIISYLKTRKTYYKIYETLPTYIIGAIPIGEGEYVLLTRRKKTIYSILFPFIFIFFFINFTKSFFS